MCGPSPPADRRDAGQDGRAYLKGREFEAYGGTYDVGTAHHGKCPRPKCAPARVAGCKSDRDVAVEVTVDVGVASRASALFFAMVGGELIPPISTREGDVALAKEMKVWVCVGGGGD